MKLQDHRTVTIYTLSCPITGMVKYVGKTVKPINERLIDHIADSKRVANKRTNWVKSIVKQGLMPVIEPLEECGEDWAATECYWIAQFKAWGFSLKNMTEGGEGAAGKTVSQETRYKISASQKGIKKTPEQVEAAKLGRLRKGGFHSTPEQRSKQSAALKGRPKTVEHNKKVGDANKGRKRSPEFSRQLSQRLKGVVPVQIMRPISQLTKEGDLVQEYDCSRYAMRETGISATAINNCLNNRSKTAGGFKWIYRSK